MERSILDTNMLMHIFRGHPKVISKATQHRNQFGHLSITILTCYEVKKGWAYNATSQNAETRRKARTRIHDFEEFCYQNEILYLTRDACKYAADIYGNRRRKGSNYQAGLDLLIAGIALAESCAVITENISDYVDIADLRVESWLI